VATASNAFSSAEMYPTVSSVLPTYEAQTDGGVPGNGSLKTAVGTDDRIVLLFKVLVGVPDGERGGSNRQSALIVTMAIWSQEIPSKPPCVEFGKPQAPVLITSVMEAVAVAVVGQPGRQLTPLLVLRSPFKTMSASQGDEVGVRCRMVSPWPEKR
jgi:hypothetical protein